MMLNNENRYECWRDRWLSGGNSQAVYVMIFHGLYRALTLVDSTPVRITPAVSQPVPFDASVSLPLINAAAHFTRRVLSENANTFEMNGAI